MGRATGGDLSWVLPLPSETWSAKIYPLAAISPTPSSFLSDAPWSDPTDSPSNPREARPKLASWDSSINAGEAGCLLWALFFPQKNPKFQTGPLGVMLCWPRGGMMQSKWNHPFYPSNMVLFGLCIQGGAFSLTFTFWYVHKNVLSMDSCQLVFSVRTEVRDHLFCYFSYLLLFF